MLFRSKEYSALTMSHSHKDFWKSPSKAREFVNKSSGKKEGGQRVRSCYNCQYRYHFVAECPFENREHHGGKLVRKVKPKIPNKKPFFKKNAQITPDEKTLTPNRFSQIRYRAPPPSPTSFGGSEGPVPAPCRDGDRPSEPSPSTSLLPAMRRE